MCKNYFGEIYSFDHPEYYYTCKLLDCPILSVRTFTKGCQFIISGSTKTSDPTIPVGLFKIRLKNILIEVQKLGNSDIWTQSNSLGC